MGWGRADSAPPLLLSNFLDSSGTAADIRHLTFSALSSANFNLKTKANHGLMRPRLESSLNFPLICTAAFSAAILKMVQLRFIVDVDGTDGRNNMQIVSVQRNVKTRETIFPTILQMKLI